jgi:tetratricopeptide (TPR) repeat protein
MENTVLNRQHRSSTVLRLQRAARVEMLAEAALSIAERYEQAGRWASALALLEAVLRDPDLPVDRPALMARIKAIQGRLLLAEAAHETGDFAPAIAALEEAAALAVAAQDQRAAALAWESLEYARASRDALAARAGSDQAISPPQSDDPR